MFSQLEALIANLEAEARAAYDDGNAVSLASFVDSFVARGLEEATRRAVEAKAEHQVWQAAQAELIAECADEGTEREFQALTTECGELRCGRVVERNFASPDDAARLRGAADAAMDGLYHQGGSTSMALDAATGLRLDDAVPGTFDLATTILERARDFVSSHFGAPRIYAAGGLITRLEAPPRQGPFQLNASHVYWKPHVDKANIAAYDYSALVYLSTHARDFQGGALEFFDGPNTRTLVHPEAGMLIAFSSGLDNLHRARRVTLGSRFVLALWFTLDPAHTFVDTSLGLNPGSR
ncbi:hypothetical protein CTAYLR_008125 [Chrysophaeum taylorii]|uniref:Fe2OG dioxygenase domain-containing protein n=1 Tax=Chrysophaeum taylorii TaxID=2483200 RepID=A0AAD7ULN4_9STRA|nr:hypothetical protein CTAYLR_008125 [Chrysophaeum taylorii]